MVTIKHRNDWIGSDLDKEEFNRSLGEEKEENSFCLKSEIKESMDRKKIREQLTNLFDRFFKKIKLGEQKND